MKRAHPGKARIRLRVAVALVCLWGYLPALLRAQPAQPGSKDITLVEAARSALEKHIALRIQEQQVAAAKAQKQQASGAFDEVLTGTISHSRPHDPLTTAQQLSDGLTVPDVVSNTTNVTVAAQRLFRNGMQIGPSYGLTRFLDNWSNLPGVNRSQLAFQVVFPLLRGRGRDVNMAQENAAGIEVDSAILDLKYTMSVLLSNVSSSYWSLAAAHQSLTVATSSETRGEAIVAAVRALIDGDQQPRSDINNTVANLADRQASRVVAQQQVWDARQHLAMDMGLTFDETPEDLTAIDDFPDAGRSPLIAEDPSSLRAYVGYALDHRADYLAARTRVSEAKLLRDAAKKQILPLLNFSFTMGYSGVAQGRQLSSYFTAVSSSVRGTDAIGAITYQLPVGNNAALGRLTQAEAALNQAELRARESARGISLTIADGVRAIRNAALRVKKAQESVEAFQRGLQAEQEKLALGVGSVVNILTVEDRLTASLQNEVQAKLSYSVALIQFRFATGSILPAGPGPITIDANIFTTFPFEVDSGSGARQ